jgi:glutathione synthase/RimK-type ligase-like ATP-grasp enzyme
MTTKYRQCAILSMDNLEDFECYDYLLDEPLKQLGWETHTVSWRDQSIDWDQFEVVIIRSPWDYQQQPEAFMSVLKKIQASKARLENNFELVEWNFNKSYLIELESNGIEIVPTLWKKAWQPDEVECYFDYYNTDQIVIKPVISANADNTYWLKKDSFKQHLSEMGKSFSSIDHMVQPFMPAIINEGEYSLFYFAGEFSHSILKTPGKEDFRVQEEHGSSLKLIQADEALRQHADRVQKQLSPEPLYSRIDLVRTDTGFAVMEVELIEPSLYFNMDPASPLRFALAFDKWMTPDQDTA